MNYKIWQTITRAVFLTLFAALLFTGRVQLWMGIFVTATVIGIFFGRFYCGWLCPINTVLHGITKLKSIFRIKDNKVPSFFKNTYTRYLVMALFAITFLYISADGQKIPVLPILLAVGIVLTFLYTEIIWHRYLCPFGTVLSLTSSRALKSLKISEEQCIRCGLCHNVCPGQAINRDEIFSIEKNSCLLCLQCMNICPKNAVNYR